MTDPEFAERIRRARHLTNATIVAAALMSLAAYGLTDWGSLVAFGIYLLVAVPAVASFIAYGFRLEDK